MYTHLNMYRLEVKAGCPSLLSVAVRVRKHMTKSNLRRKGFVWLTLTVHHQGKEVRAGPWRKEWKQKPWGSMGLLRLLTHPGLPPRDETESSGLGPHTWHFSSEALCPGDPSLCHPPAQLGRLATERREAIASVSPTRPLLLSC